jgi:decaprenylphospho-beta-D-erythro-pentofuranosid-2-ulose 2-reductase
MAKVTSRDTRVLVLGGTSEIAGAIVRELAARNGACEVVLAGRDPQALERAARQLRSAGPARVGTLALDALERDGHEAALERAWAQLGGGVDVAILAVGLLGERGGLPQDIAGALEVLDVNLVGAGSLLLHSARLLREQPGGGGTLVVLSSVAALRARASNVVYGASKAGLDALAQGLADALSGSGVRVLVVRPGFVHTRMTRGLRVPPLATTPEQVARATVAGLQRGRQTVWAPGAMRWVMLALCALPRRVFRRLAL